MTQIQAAYQEYINRQTGKSRPDGTFDYNKGITTGSYRLHETQPCCESISDLHAHAKSAKHVAHLYGLDPREFTQYCSVRRMKETTKQRRR